MRKFFFVRNTRSDSVLYAAVEFFLKKYFGGMENGCIFASAFAEKRGLLKTPERGQENIETDEKTEIACVVIHIKICVRHEDESKGKENNSYNEEFDPGSG